MKLKLRRFSGTHAAEQVKVEAEEVLGSDHKSLMQRLKRELAD